VPELSDPLIALREWRPDDAPALAPMCGGPEWDPRHTSLPAEWSQPAARAWIWKQRRHRCAGTAVALAITRAGEDVPVGNVNLVRFSDDGLSAALGYWLVPAARGEGLATAAARLLCRWGFEELGLERIELLVEPENEPSRRVADRLGARSDGARAHPAHPGGPELAACELSPAALAAPR
jgi:[ribosomal protein S5]-alanine N-acetyltransferase